MSIRRIPITNMNVVLKPENGALDLYLITALKKVSITGTIKPATKVNLHQAARTMYEEMPKHFNNWIGSLSAAMMMLHFISVRGEFPFDEDSHMAWDQGFYFGVMTERLRKKYGIEFESEVVPVSAEEMQELTEDRDDDEDEDDDE